MGRAGKTGTKASDAPSRREQIISTTIELLSRHGLPGTTTARIAREVGISEPALYRHFRNKEEILLAALDEVSARLLQLMNEAASSERLVAKKLHRMSAALYEFVMSHPEEAIALFEVFSASRDNHLKQVLQNRFLGSLAIVEEMLEQGIRQGELRPDIDVALTAWKVVSLGITLNFAAMLGLSHVLTEERALSAVDQLLEEIVLQEEERSEKG
jgi:AcrR family transcriptional regulator